MSLTSTLIDMTVVDVINEELPRLSADQSVIKMVAITQNSKNDTKVLSMLGYGLHFYVINSGLWPPF